MSAGLRRPTSSSPFLKKKTSVLVYTHVCVSVFMGTPFFLSRLVYTQLILRMEHLWIPGRISHWA
jgi:hypothetical protein